MNAARARLIAHWVFVYLPIAIPVLLLACAIRRVHPRVMWRGLAAEFRHDFHPCNLETTYV